MNKKSNNKKNKKGTPAVSAEPPKPNFKLFNDIYSIFDEGLSVLKEV